MDYENQKESSQTYQNQQQYVSPPPGIFDEGPSGKARGVAGLLAFLVGGLGVHYFYCNKPVGGLLCILLTFCTCGLFGIIILIQAIMFFMMNQDEFERKWVNSTTAMPFL